MKIIDWKTFLHAVVGFNLNPLSRKIVYPSIIGWEAFQFLISKTPPNVLNSLSDIAVGIGSYEIGKKYGQVKI